MNKIVYNDKKIIHQHIKDMNDLADTLKLKSVSDANSSSSEKDSGFNDFNSIDDFVDNFSTGEVEFNSSNLTDLKYKKKDISNRRRQVKSLSGNPSVARYLSGHPKSCYQVCPTPHRGIKNFVLLFSYAAVYTPEEILKIQEDSLALYEKYPGNKTLTIAYVSRMGYDYEWRMVNTIDVTKEQKTNLKTIKQMCMSADSLRRVSFKMKEICDHEVVLESVPGSYGSPIIDPDEVLETLRSIGMKNTSLIFKGEEYE